VNDFPEMLVHQEVRLRVREKPSRELLPRLLLRAYQQKKPQQKSRQLPHLRAQPSDEPMQDPTQELWLLRVLKNTSSVLLLQLLRQETDQVLLKMDVQDA
jgi:hypothetical protein